MQPLRWNKILGVISGVGFLTSFAYGATITGTVKGPDGVPFRGAFVEARNPKTRITVMVLSDKNGQYRVENLAAGDYEVLARAIGYRSDVRTGILLTDTQSFTLDRSLQKQTLRWTDVTVNQWFNLLPEKKGKAQFIQFCGLSCHGGFQNMVGLSRNETSWRDAVTNMRVRIGGGIINAMKDDDAAVLGTYLSTTFSTGPEALPKSPADLPGYKGAEPQFSDEALKIVYVMYEMPANRVTWDANPDKDGNVWLPYFGAVNGVGKLNPKTGQLEEFLWPDQTHRTATRSAYVAPDGTPWIVEEGGTLVKLDPKTGKIEKYKGPGRGMNTVRADPRGILWVSGTPYSYRFDPKTGKYTELTDAPATYAANLDKAGNIWFDEGTGQGRIFKVDYKTAKVTTWTPPPAAGSRRRIQVDSNGIVWVALYTAGKLVRLAPETGSFKVYDLPGEQPTPYPIGIDANNQVWYASGYMDTVGRIDPATDKIMEYPVPAFSNGMRELNIDAQGRMWFASPGNNTVGYFYLAK